jgi:hypothetical protein
MTNPHQPHTRASDRTMSKQLALALTALFVAGTLMFTGGQARANHGPYVIGDVFASVHNTTLGNTVRRYSPLGAPLEALPTGTPTYTAAGSCFDGSGQLRVTNFSDNTLTRFGAPGTGTTTYPWVSGITSDPESCRVENAPSGNIFVGVADGDQDVRKYSPSGTLLASYNVATEDRGSDWVDLLPTDNCQLYYTSEGDLVKRFNVCTNTQLPDFASGLGIGGPCFAVRVRPDGHVFVACTDRVWHLDAAGANVPPSPYMRSSLLSPSAGSETGTLFAMNLDPDNLTLWTGGLETGHIYRINIATGAQVFTFNGFQPGDDTLGGLTIFGEIGPPPPQPATDLDLTPKTATNPVDTQHCVTATVTDSAGNPSPGITVRFTVSGSVNTSGSETTDANGQAEFCYTGPPLPGADAIKAYADTDNDNMQDAGEPFDTATKAWVLPVSTPLCEIKVNNGGWFFADNLDRVSFGGMAKSDGDGNTSGDEEFQDHGPVQPFNLHGDPTAVICPNDPTRATIFGTATINGAGSFTFRIDVVDNGEGNHADRYRMRVDGYYDSGEHTLRGGNVQIHRG